MGWGWGQLCPYCGFQAEFSCWVRRKFSPNFFLLRLPLVHHLDTSDIQRWPGPDRGLVHGRQAQEGAAAEVGPGAHEQRVPGRHRGRVPYLTRAPLTVFLAAQIANHTSNPHLRETVSTRKAPRKIVTVYALA